MDEKSVLASCIPKSEGRSTVTAATIPLDRVYDVLETAEHLGVCHVVVRNAIKSGQLRAVKVGRQWRISTSAINEYVNRGAGQHD
jgi:excisionase family DNA binding protein